MAVRPEPYFPGFLKSVHADPFDGELIGNGTVYQNRVPDDMHLVERFVTGKGIDLVFFKARDADALTAAFKEYTAKTDRKKERPSVLKKLRKFKEVAADIDTPKVRKKELDAR